MTIKVYKYPYGNGVNVSPVSIKQYINNGATLVKGGGGMPMKPRYADNASSFAIGRQSYTSTPIGFGLVQDFDNKLKCKTGSIRVDIKPNTNNYNITAKSLVNKPTFKDNIWSTSSYRAPTKTNTINVQNGKMTNILSSDEHINRKKNLAIGKGSRGSSKVGDQNGPLSFNSNNLYGSHTNYLEETKAKRRTRNSGYVVPPKCRGLGSGPSGPFGAVSNRGTLKETGPGLKPQNPNGTSCGKAGWSINTLLGDNSTSTNEIITTKLFNLNPVVIGVTTVSTTMKLT